MDRRDAGWIYQLVEVCLNTRTSCPHNELHVVKHNYQILKASRGRVRSCNRRLALILSTVEILPVAHFVFGLGVVSFSRQQSFKVLDDPPCCLAIPFGRNRAFSHCPAIIRASAGGSLLGSVPMSSFVPILIVSGRSVLSRRVKHGTPSMVVSLVCLVHLVYLVSFVAGPRETKQTK
jgi:hypothetical protein